MSNLAYSMFLWIRSNKDELARITKQHPELPIQSLLYFERRYRGASHWLKNPAARDIPRGFASTLKQNLWHLLETLRPHRKQFSEAHCTSLFDMPGLSENEYHEFYRQHLSMKLTTAAREKDNLAISHNGRYGQLTLKMSNGIATTTHQWDYATTLPEQAHGDLRQQLEGLDKGWIAIREAFTAFINDPANWPSDTVRFNEEQERIARITKRLLDSLCTEDLALLRKHQTVFKQHLNTRLA